MITDEPELDVYTGCLLWSLADKNINIFKIVQICSLYKSPQKPF